MTIRTTLITSSLIAASLIAASLISGTAHAALQGRDLNGSAGSFEAYYDTDLNITWLANANVKGPMDWDAANTWAADLSFTDGVNTYADWRLPISDTCTVYNCTGSEMGYLFYNVLGNNALFYIPAVHVPQVGDGLTNTGPFSRLQANVYWSGTEYASGNGLAWSFYFGSGGQLTSYKHNGFHALAVSPGDVGAVPEAETYALMLAGLGLIGWRARRRG